MPEKLSPKTSFNKILKGIIIGGAIGSILGMSINSRPGRAAGSAIQQKSRGALSSFFRGISALIRGRKKS